MTYKAHIKDGVAILDDPVVLADGTRVRVEVESTNDFRSNREIDELAAEQGVNPLRSGDELRADWPEEDSIDEFLAAIREVRR